MSNDERRTVLGLCHERAKASGLVWMIGEDTRSIEDQEIALRQLLDI